MNGRKSAPSISATVAAGIPADHQPFVVEKISSLRSRIAPRLIQSKQSMAHVWASVEVDYEHVESVRDTYGARFREEGGYSLTYLPFVARAAIDALAAYPAVNSIFDIEAGEQTFYKAVNLGIAIDLNQKGLVVANVPDADGMTLRGVATSIRAVPARRKTESLDPKTSRDSRSPSRTPVLSARSRQHRSLLLRTPRF